MQHSPFLPQPPRLMLSHLASLLPISPPFPLPMPLAVQQLPLGLLLLLLLGLLLLLLLLLLDLLRPPSPPQPIPLLLPRPLCTQRLAPPTLRAHTCCCQAAPTPPC